MIKLGRSFWWVLAILCVTFFISRLPSTSGNPIFLRLVIVMLILLVVNFLWSLFSIIGLDIIRITRVSHKQVGEVFTENFEVINHSFISKAWVKISDQADLPGRAGSRVMTWIGGGRSRIYMADSLLKKRGWFQLGPTLIETGDVFGLFLLRKTVIPQSRLLVIPYTFNIQNFPAPFGILAGGRALRQKTLEVTPYAAGVREFVHGDSLKRIHWPTSARKQKLIVKEFEKDPLAEVWIFIDARETVHIHSQNKNELDPEDFWWLKQSKTFELPPDTEEYAVSIAASIAKYYINQKREVGLACAGQGYSILPAERGERQLGKILEALAVLHVEGEMPLWGLFSSQLAHLARGSTIIIITPSTDQKILTFLMEFIQRGLIPVVILIDQDSFGGDVDSSALKGGLSRRGILTFVVREGDPIDSIFDKPEHIFDERIMFRGL
ncbi:MAG: DUF58 domain-containing protein [Chloroflexota bacterium]|nr:DUF58 domain-containing protein [Chloroflexota bacterium]